MKKLLLLVGMFCVAANGESLNKNIQDTLDAIKGHLPKFDYDNISKCMKSSAKEDCFPAIADVQIAKALLKGKVENFNKGATALQMVLLEKIKHTATVEDLLRFWVTPVGNKSLEDAQEHRFIKKRD